VQTVSELRLAVGDAEGALEALLAHSTRLGSPAATLHALLAAQRELGARGHHAISGRVARAALALLAQEGFAEVRELDGLVMSGPDAVRSVFHAHAFRCALLIGDFDGAFEAAAATPVSDTRGECLRLLVATLLSRGRADALVSLPWGARWDELEGGLREGVSARGSLPLPRGR
jgi:hypothetical protein